MRFLPGKDRGSISVKPKKALLVVDVQNDFCPGGALGIKDGDKIVPLINEYIGIFTAEKLPVFVTRDLHPQKTKHFKKFGGVWPVHCVENTPGAAFHPKLKIPKTAIIVSKGMDPGKDSYSAFQAEDASGMSLVNLLKVIGIEEIYVAGLATDYCVKYSTLEAIKNGFRVKVLIDAVKGVDLKPGDSEKALKEMIKMGAELIHIGHCKTKGGRKNATG